MKRLLLAALAVPLGLGSPQEQVTRPKRVTISGATYKKMHRAVPVYAGAAHVADVLYAIGDGHESVEVEVPVIAPLGNEIPQHPAIASGRLLHRLDVERIRMTKFNAVESVDAKGVNFVKVTTTLAFEMPPAEDDKLAAEIIGLALGVDPRITVMSQPEGTVSSTDGVFEIQGLTLHVALPQYADAAPVPKPAPWEDVDLSAVSNSFAAFARSQAQNSYVKLGSIILARPKPLPADRTGLEGVRQVVRTTGKPGTKITVAKIANFTVRCSNLSRRASQVGLAVEVDEGGTLEMKAVFDIR